MIKQSGMENRKWKISCHVNPFIGAQIDKQPAIMTRICFVFLCCFCTKTFQIISQFPLFLVKWTRNRQWSVSISSVHKHLTSSFTNAGLFLWGGGKAKFMSVEKAKCIKRNDCQSFSCMKDRLSNEWENETFIITFCMQPKYGRDGVRAVNLEVERWCFMSLIAKVCLLFDKEFERRGSI